VKIFEQEEALPTYVLLDRSASMSVGSPSKLQLGAQVAAALAYVGLANQDYVRVSLFAGNGVCHQRLSRSGGRAQGHSPADVLLLPRHSRLRPYRPTRA
jgi:uncharacterized protein (DUF58 family)